MIKLTTLNGEHIVVNCNQIESVETIPESKVILLNKDFYIVKESIDEIINKVIEYNARIYTLQKKILIIDNIDKNFE